MRDLNELASYCKNYDCVMLKDEPLKNHTTFRIGGCCNALIVISNVKALQKLVVFCNENKIPWMVLGNGSNVLVSDSGYDGVIFQLGKSFSKIQMQSETLISCESGALLSAAGHFALDKSLTGMECLSGIPGTIGGALYMNAGAYGSDMSNVVVSAEFIYESGNIKTITKEEMELGYRKSIFSGTRCIITKIILKLEKGKYSDIKDEMDSLMRQRRAKQPLELPSAGSTFKRPVGNYASFLIDQCGLKGASVGDAQVSTKHAGFVVNTGHATCANVLELCDFVIETVKEKTGYELELEPIIIK
ncbi:MAG: UDP-N-acetylmuramate dehydrogenase [Ruminococcus sp.]|nr:UDP-N-acetylmuramate dehydrogenase [Ruminococcus sp.]